MDEIFQCVREKEIQPNFLSTSSYIAYKCKVLATQCTIILMNEFWGNFFINTCWVVLLNHISGIASNFLNFTAKMERRRKKICTSTSTAKYTSKAIKAFQISHSQTIVSKTITAAQYTLRRDFLHILFSFACAPSAIQTIQFDINEWGRLKIYGA